MIKLSRKELVETVMVTVIMIVIVDLVMTVAVILVVGVLRVVQVVVGIASSVANLVTLLESAQMVMVGEVTDTVAGMIGMVVVDLTVAATDLTVGVTDLTVVVTDILVVAEMVEVEVTVTVATDLVPIDGLDLEMYFLSRYENRIYYHEAWFLVFETLWSCI